MEPPPFSMMNREERHLCAILYHLLAFPDNLRAFQAMLGLQARDDAEVFVEAAFVRDYFDWWCRTHRSLRKEPREFDELCKGVFGIRLGLPDQFRAPDGFLSLRLLRNEREWFDDDCCALLPRLANMRFDVLLITPITFAVIETKLHSPLLAQQMHLQHVVGRMILNRLPGYEGHAFRHYLVSNGQHPNLERQVALCRPAIEGLHIERRSWADVVGALPRVPPRQRKEIRDMLSPRP
jgi:hypothetical protein